MKMKISCFAPNLVYDSGMGGLSTLSELKKALPNENFVYFADFLNAPYGNHKAKFINSVVLYNIKKLIKIWQPKSIVLACNTATSVCIQKLRQLYPHLIIVGLEPAIKPAVLSGCNNILVLGTKLTLRHSGIVKLFAENKKEGITFLELYNMAKIVDKYYFCEKKLQEKIKKCLKNLWGKFDAVVLGCTHYVLVKKQILACLGDGVTAFDGNSGVAKRLKNCLTALNLNSTSKSFDVVFTSSVPKKANLLKAAFFKQMEV